MDSSINTATNVAQPSFSTCNQCAKEKPPQDFLDKIEKTDSCLCSVPLCKNCYQDMKPTHSIVCITDNQNKLMFLGTVEEKLCPECRLPIKTSYNPPSLSTTIPDDVESVYSVEADDGRSSPLPPATLIPPAQ